MVRIKKEVLSSKVYGALKEMIAHYRFQPGARLNVEKLTSELKVSRTPVWEAVRRLEQEGLLKSIPNRGVFMVDMTLPMALELYQVRGVLDGLAGRLAAQQIDKKMLDRMAKCLEAQARVIEEGDLIGYSKLDFDFHTMIYKTSRNAFLQEMLDSLKMKMQPLNLQIRPILLRLYQDHMEILETFRSKDPEAAERALVRHNRKVENQIRREIEVTSSGIRKSTGARGIEVR